MAFHSIKNVMSAFRSRTESPRVFDASKKIKALLPHDKKSAADCLAQALEQFPGHSSLEDMRHFLGQNRLQERLGELKTVVDEARRAYVQAARAFADTDNTTKAIEFITGAFKRFPECAELHLLLGEIYLRRWLDDLNVEDGALACECLERAAALDGTTLAARRYLAGFYARAGCFRKATELLSSLDGKSADEEENRYMRELGTWCARRVEDSAEEDLPARLGAVWDARAFAADCRDWARPRPPVFARCDMKGVMVPFVALEVVGRRAVDLPGVQAVVVQNAVRSETIRAEGCTVEPSTLEGVVRGVAAAASESCWRMKLGHAKRVDLKTSAGRANLVIFADSWTAVLFAPGVGDTQAAIVMQQFLDHVAEKLGEIHELHS